MIVINDLGKASTILDEYATKMGVETPGLQRRISRMLGVSGQLNAGKPLMIVILNKETFGDQPVGPVHLFLDVLRDAGIELGFEVGQRIGRGVSETLGK